MTKRTALITALSLGGVIFCASALQVSAQGGGANSIRVESNQVLVPAAFIDKEREKQLLHKRLGTVTPENRHLLEESVNAITISDLTAKEIHVFEDGTEQAIQNLTPEHALYWDFQDNFGYHTEYMGQGGGIWTGTDWPPDKSAEIIVPQYVIAYAAPPSKEGSCHQIKVTVDRPNALVYARNEYCNTSHSIKDLLNGTDLNKTMETEMLSAKKSNIDLTLFALPFYTETESARVQIAVDFRQKLFRPQSRKPESKRIGVLGTFYKKDKTVAARFSDLFEIQAVPVRYETQVNLPPGEYDLRVVLNDGSKFGRAEISLTVEAYDKGELSTSAIAFCRRIQGVLGGSRKSPSMLLGNWDARSTGMYAPLVSKDIEVKPSGNTHFKRGDRFYVYFEVYEPMISGPSAITVRTHIRFVDAKTGEIAADFQQGSAADYVKSGSPVIPIGQGFDTSKVQNGSYRLEVQASDSLGKTTTWRTANFTIE